jgi:hypothetical protein
LARDLVIGVCHLCGERKPLTFEHVPPRRAYNDFLRFHFHTQEYIAHRYRGGPAPAVIPDARGAGAYTLCGGCNQRCSRYAQHFIEWAIFWQTALDSDPAAESIAASQITRRSRVMKQIVAMLLSACPPKTGEINPGLRRFVWDAETKGLPAGIRVHAALTRDRDARQAGGAGRLNTQDGTGSVFNEIAFAPLILVMTLQDTPAPDARLVDITFFATAGYFDREPTQLMLRVLRLRDFHPGAYE